MVNKIRLDLFFFSTVFVFLYLGIQAGLAEVKKPPIIAEIQNASGDTLWSQDDPDNELDLNPGQKIVIIGENFGTGPITSAIPGLNEPNNKPKDFDLSKILFGNVRAMERNLRSYPGKISVATFAKHKIFDCDLFIEERAEFPDTWVADIINWENERIVLTVPITAYEGPIVIWKVSPNGEFIKDISKCEKTLESCEELKYRDPNTERVTDEGFLGCGDPVFNETYRIARVTGQKPVQSNAVKVNIALGKDNRFRYALEAKRSKKPLNDIEKEGGEHRKEKLKDAKNKEVVKDIATRRSAKDQFDYGEETFFAFDWNLGVAHLFAGIDWDGVFGFTPNEHWLLRYRPNWGKRDRVDYGDGYDFPNFKDGKMSKFISEEGWFVPPRELPEKDLAQHLPYREFTTNEALIPLESFGAIPLLPDEGVDRLVAPMLLFEEIVFKYPEIYPVQNSIKILRSPLKEGKTQPTGWVGYVYADGIDPITQTKGQWIGFNCSSCHSIRVTYEYNSAGDKISKIFSGVPNYNWKSTFVSYSGRARGLKGKEPLPDQFINADYSSESQEAKEIDKTLLIHNLPPGTTEATLLLNPEEHDPYKNDYFFSPVVIAMISNHTPVRRALSHSELLDGFEGAYLHGQEPDGTRGAMTSQGLQDLTLFASTLGQEDEILRRIGMYRWLKHKDLLHLISDNAPNEGTFVSFDNDPGLTPASFPPRKDNPGGLADIRDLGEEAMELKGDEGKPTFAQTFPKLVNKIVSGHQIFDAQCVSCHTPNNATWTNEDMHPISEAGGGQPVGRYFSPSIWQRKVQSIRVAILQNLFWAQKRGLLSDGHVMAEDADRNENINGLETLVHPDRCKKDSNLYKRLYTINEHTFRIPVEGEPFSSYKNSISRRKVGKVDGVGQGIEPGDERVSKEQDEFVRRHAYFTKKKLKEDDQEYYYWDYQKMKDEYGILEYGLAPGDPGVGGFPEVPHPWCVENAHEVEDLVTFLLTL